MNGVCCKRHRSPCKLKSSVSHLTLYTTLHLPSDLGRQVGGGGCSLAGCLEVLPVGGHVARGRSPKLHA